MVCADILSTMNFAVMLVVSVSLQQAYGGKKTPML